MSNGIFDQLENLNHQPTVKHGSVRSPNPSKTVQTTENGQTPLNGKNETKNRPTPPQVDQVPTSDVTQNSTQESDRSRKPSSESPREKSRSLPTRTEIQEFSFRLRDDLKVKVQAEVPHEWQDELEEVARKLDVKKLELYRFIFGEFLGKVKRKKDT